ncbi:hypothetical protein KY361_05690 [Candidatus Woesearchaeota archaeon]|nr:hypothetical protein [Candidatus Woesearchaeota archaeon]
MKGYLRYVIITLFLLSVIPAVSAIGLAARSMWVKMDYVPNLEFTQTYQIITTSDYTQDYTLYVTGGLGQYITIEPDQFKDIVPGSDPYFTVSLKLPEGLDKEVSPGIHQIRIGVKETVSSSGGKGIGLLTSSEAIIDVRFLYPGKYLTAKLNVKDVEVNKPANFKINVYNGGKEDINSVRAKIEVYDSNGNKVAMAYTEEKSLKSNAEDTLHAQLSTEGLKSGEYKAVATVYYDMKELKTNEAKFKIGSLEIWIIDYTKEVPAGKINPFDIEIESRWNNQIQNVYAIVTIGRRTFQTPSTNIAPWEKKTITGYFDATNMGVGEYDAEIILYFGDNTAKELGKVTITKPEEVMLMPVITPTTTLLVIIIILLVIADIIYLVYSKKHKTYKEELEMLKMQMKTKQRKGK